MSLKELREIAARTLDAREGVNLDEWPPEYRLFGEVALGVHDFISVFSMVADRVSPCLDRLEIPGDPDDFLSRVVTLAEVAAGHALRARRLGLSVDAVGAVLDGYGIADRDVLSERVDIVAAAFKDVAQRRREILADVAESLEPLYPGRFPEGALLAALSGTQRATALSSFLRPDGVALGDVGAMVRALGEAGRVFRDDSLPEFVPDVSSGVRWLAERVSSIESAATRVSHRLDAVGVPVEVDEEPLPVEERIGWLAAEYQRVGSELSRANDAIRALERTAADRFSASSDKEHDLDAIRAALDGVVRDDGSSLPFRVQWLAAGYARRGDRIDGTDPLYRDRGSLDLAVVDDLLDSYGVPRGGVHKRIVWLASHLPEPGIKTPTILARGEALSDPSRARVEPVVPEPSSTEERALRGLKRIEDHLDRAGIPGGSTDWRVEILAGDYSRIRHALKSPLQIRDGLLPHVELDAVERVLRYVARGELALSPFEDRAEKLTETVRGLLAETTDADRALNECGAPLGPVPERIRWLNRLALEREQVLALIGRHLDRLKAPPAPLLSRVRNALNVAGVNEDVEERRGYVLADLDALGAPLTATPGGSDWLTLPERVRWLVCNPREVIPKSEGLATPLPGDPSPLVSWLKRFDSVEVARECLIDESSAAAVLMHLDCVALAHYGEPEGSEGINPPDPYPGQVWSEDADGAPLLVAGISEEGVPYSLGVLHDAATDGSPVVEPCYLDEWPPPGRDLVAGVGSPWARSGDFLSALVASLPEPEEDVPTFKPARDVEKFNTEITFEDSEGKELIVSGSMEMNLDALKATPDGDLVVPLTARVVTLSGSALDSEPLSEDNLPEGALLASVFRLPLTLAPGSRVGLGFGYPGDGDILVVPRVGTGTSRLYAVVYPPGADLGVVSRALVGLEVSQNGPHGAEVATQPTIDPVASGDISNSGEE